jgi:large repetitive protein
VSLAGYSDGILPIYQGLSIDRNFSVSGARGSVTSWSISSGTMPQGLTLSQSGAIVGTPASSDSGFIPVTFVATDSAGDVSPPYRVTFDIIPPPKVSAERLPRARLHRQYTVKLSATEWGFDLPSWTIASGALPEGLALSTKGVISGVPKSSGTFKFKILITDGIGTQSQPVAFLISVKK